MAEKKITDLPESSHILESDFVEFVDTNSNTSKKITLENVAKSISHGDLAGLSDNDHPQYSLTTHDHDSDYLGITAKAADSDKLDGVDSTGYVKADGWTPVSGTWAYASATTITVPSGAASLYAIGDKFKLTANSVVLQGYIVGIADTVLTVVGDALTNHTFSACYYSHEASPVGFPGWFGWTPTLNTGNSRLSGFTTARYLVQGKVVHLVFGANNVSVTGSIAGYIVVSLPNLGTYQASRQLYQLYASGSGPVALAVVTGSELRLFKTGWFGNWQNNETGVYIEVTITLGLA